MSDLAARSETVRCADESRALAVDPAGSAVFLHEAVVVDTPLPWPKPALDHPRLAHLPEAVASAAQNGRQVRVLAAVPDLAAVPTMVRIVHHRRPADEWAQCFERSEYLVPADEAREAAAALVGGAAIGSAWRVDSPTGIDLLICTQGSHDSCCGRYGMRLQAAVQSRWGHVRVTRVSHTGGHRFAPTGISFPDGRYWGYLDESTCDRIVARSGPIAPVLAHLRGSCGAPSPMEQVAERAVMAEVGWDWDLRLRRTTVIESDHDAGRIAVESIDADGGHTRHEVDVERRRTLPVVNCGAPGGLPHDKQQHEYGVRAVRTG